MLPPLWLVTHDDVTPDRLLFTWSAVRRHTPDATVGLSIRTRRLAVPALVELCRAALALGGSVLVSRRVDIACVIPGLGVHLPATGLPTADARSLLPAGRLLLRAAHHRLQLEEARGADAVLVSPVFPPRSHAAQRPPLGVDGLAGLVAASSTPVIALGGIRVADVGRLRDVGAAGIAVTTEILDAPDPGAAAAALVRAWAGG